MINPISIESLANKIRTLYKSDPSRSETLIEKYLEERLKGLLPAERLSFLEKLTEQFKDLTPKILPDVRLKQEGFSRLFSLLLGKKISTADLSSAELLEKLAHSLNTIFDTLNQIVSVIHITLLGEKVELETIRHIIGSNLEGEGRSDSLQSYLDQIQEAFLVAHRALKQAAQTKMNEILTELNPDRFETSSRGGLKFGPLRKAELFEIYKEKFSNCKGWFESGRFMEELLREFEKTCQTLYNVDGRREK
jgi:hypothetical protein